MRWFKALFILLIFLVIILLLIYFFVPFGMTEFGNGGVNSSIDTNFNPNIGSSMQFYPNMRYADKVIGYHIDASCPLKKKNDMEEALNIISNLTIVHFNSVYPGEELSITCSDENIVSGNTFVAGEGGVTNVSVVGNYHVIFQGKVLLIRDSNCQRPNVAIHELLHSMGFSHSENPHNIMYDTMDCNQLIGNDIPELINTLYSIPSNPDLVFEDVQASMNGRYLNANISIRNQGFANSPHSTIIISADGKVVKEVYVGQVDIGFGRRVSLSNLWINQMSVDELKLEIVSDFEELDKENNVYYLSVKK